ncbi:MAG: hypothetical protein ABR592_12855 [Nitriliruptorales bacterium]
MPITDYVTPTGLASRTTAGHDLAGEAKCWSCGSTVEGARMLGDAIGEASGSVAGMRLLPAEYGSLRL